MMILNIITPFEAQHGWESNLMETVTVSTVLISQQGRVPSPDDSSADSLLKNLCRNACVGLEQLDGIVDSLFTGCILESLSRH